MKDAILYVPIFLISMIEIWAAIPIGIGLKTNPIMLIAMTSLGAISGVLVVVFIGTRIRTWLINRHPIQKSGGRKSLIVQIWDKYGIIGLSLLAPLITGAPIGAAIAIGLGETKRRILLWMIPGILIWSTILTLIAIFGINALE